MDSLLRLLMGPWTTYVLWVLSTNGPTRFGELKRRVPGVSAKVLTDRLRMLVEAGVIYRRYEPTIPPRVTYGLAERGEELREILDSLNAVALRWQANEEGLPDGARLSAIAAAELNEPETPDAEVAEEEEMPRPAERGIRRAAG
jgi:DNA-binding HxlR family transcriptional regulator